MSDALFSPAAARNAAPIVEVLKRVLPPSGLVLEIASGSGEHAAHFARALPALIWQPSDPEEAARRSIVAHARAAGLANIRLPLAIDATRQPWPVIRVDAVVAINMIHIAPWDATIGLMAGAQATLPEGVFSTSTVLFGRMAPTPHRATPRSTTACARGMPPGASAISKRSRRSAERTICIWSSASRCRPTTSV